MKLRRLPETDLARIAPLAAAEKRKRLEAHKLTGGSWSYDPAKAQYFNIANPVNPLGLRSEAPSQAQIAELLRAQCKWNEQLSSCVQITEVFAEWFKETATDAFEFRVPGMAIGALGSVRYWENFAVLIDEKPTFIWTDCRRQRGLDELGLKFAFSMMHQQIRMTYPDYFEAGLGILQYPCVGKTERVALMRDASEVELFSLAELTAMIEETYSIWQDVLTDRGREEPKRAGGLF